MFPLPAIKAVCWQHTSTKLIDACIASILMVMGSGWSDPTWKSACIHKATLTVWPIDLLNSPIIEIINVWQIIQFYSQLASQPGCFTAWLSCPSRLFWTTACVSMWPCPLSNIFIAAVTIIVTLLISICSYIPPFQTFFVLSLLMHWCTNIAHAASVKPLKAGLQYVRCSQYDVRWHKA